MNNAPLAAAAPANPEPRVALSAQAVASYYGCMVKVSAFVQHWIVPASPRAPRVAHLSGPNGETPLCGERRHAWNPLHLTGNPDGVPRCRLCLRRWRGLQPTTVDDNVVPHRFVGQYQAFLDRLARRNLSAHTRRSYASNAAAFLRWAAERNLAPQQWGRPQSIGEYEAFVAELDLGAAGINARMLGLDGLTGALRIRRTQPTPRAHRPTVPGDVLGPHQLAQVMTAARASSPTAAVLVAILSSTGCKPSQIENLTVDDVARVDDQRVRLTIGNRQVLIPLDRDALPATATGPLLRSTTGPTSISPRRIRQLLTAIGHQAGIDNLNASTFRTTWIAQRIYAGVPDHDIQEELGLTDLRTDPALAGISARHTAQRAELRNLPARTRTLSKTAGLELIQTLQQTQQALGAQQPPLDDETIDDNLRALRQIRHIDQLALETVEAHRATFQAIYQTYPVTGPAWLMHQPAGLAIWAAIADQGVIVNLNIDDLTSIWRAATAL